MNQRILALQETLKHKDPTKLSMVIGFDGFVDEIIHAVDKRQSTTAFTRIETISAFAKRIERASGLSTNIELVPALKKLGGNGPIMANALAMHRANMAYVGALGTPSIEDVFLPMQESATLYSFANPGHTDALEFDDGKLLMGKTVSMNDITYEKLLSSLGEAKLIELLSNADLFATVNWSMLPYMTDLWKKMNDQLLPKLPKTTKKRHLFVDLADPEKRDPQDIKDALNLLKRFKQTHFVVLGLNKKEAYDVAKVLDLFDHPSLEAMQVSLEDVNRALYRYLEINAVVIHPVDRSCTVVEGVYAEALGPYVAKPKLTTGAGDNFNAGFMLGLLLGLDPEQALLTGMGTSGFYVRNAHSPSTSELIAFLGEWGHGRV
jgi:sugar/nucleoside kinase (ribokinase family)